MDDFIFIHFLSQFLLCYQHLFTLTILCIFKETKKIINLVSVEFEETL